MKLSTILFPVWLILIVLGFWFWRTHELKNFVESKVKEIEENQSGKYTFKHGGIESRGFPFKSEVAIKYPSFTTNNDANEVHEFFVDGDLIIGTSLSGSEMWVKKEGPTHVLAKEGDGNSDHWILTGDTTLTFNPEGTGLFTVIPKSFKEGDTKQILKDIARKGQVHSENVQIKNVLHGGEVNLADVVDTEDAANILDVKTADAGWKISSKDKDLDQFTFSGDARYENSFVTKDSKESEKLPDLGLYKFDFEGQTTYDKSLDWGNWEQVFESLQTKPFSFEITKLNNSNKYDSSNSSFVLNTTPQKNGKIDLHVDGQNNAKFSKEGYDVVIFQLKQMLENAKENVPAEQKDIYAKLPSLITEIFPRYYELGKVNSRVNFDVDFGGGIIPMMLNNIDLKNFDWTSPLYGIRINGNFRGPMEGFLGSANISLDNYRHLVESLASYYNSVLMSLSKSFGEQEINKFARQVPPNLVEKLIVFLNKVSNEPGKEAKDITITITHNSEGVKIGTLKAEEVAMEGFQLIKEIETAVRPPEEAAPEAPAPKTAEPLIPAEPAVK